MNTAEYVTVEELAALLGVTEETVRRWLRSGALHGIRLPTRRAGWRIPRSEVRRLLELDQEEPRERRPAADEPAAPATPSAS